MRVFFSASRTAMEKYGKNYQRIVSLLKDEKFDVFDDTVVVDSDPLKVELKDKKVLHRKTVNEMDKADILIFEASWPSTIYVGFKITLAFGKGKPVVVLYKEGSGFDPSWYEGLETRNAIWVGYTDENLEEKLLLAVEEASKKGLVRFNLFIPKTLIAHLERMAKMEGVNKSQYLRKLIEREVR